MIAETPAAPDSAKQPTARPADNRSPARFAVIIGLAVFITEMALMLLLSTLQLSTPLAMLLDAGLLIAFLSPVLYMFLFRPLVLEIAERRQTEEKIRHLNQVLHAIRNVNQLIAREKDHHRLIQGACDSLVETRGYHNAWIALVGDAGELVTAAEAGIGHDFTAFIERLASGETVHCLRLSLVQDSVHAITEPVAMCTGCPLSDRHAGRAGLAVRLGHSGMVYGLLTVSVSPEFVRDKEEHALLKEVADDIALALHGIGVEQSRQQAEKALRESEERYRALFETANDAIFLMAGDRFVDCNPRAVTMFGVTREQILNHAPDQLSPPVQSDGRSSREKTLEKIGLASSGEPQFFEWHHIRGDGTPFEAQVSLNRVEIAGEPFLQSIVRDVTVQKQAEEALRAERDRAQKYLDVAGVMFVAIDADQRISLINRRGCEILGYEEAEIVGRNWFDTCIPERLRDTVKVVFDQLMNGEIEPVEYFENPVITKSGEERLIAWHNTLLFDDAGSTAGTLSSGEDVTERKQAKEALRESEERYRLHFEHISDVIYSIDPELRVLDVTPSVEMMLGYKPEELIGRPFQELNVLAPAYLERAFSDAMRVLGGERVTSAVYQFIARDGTQKWGEVSGAPLMRGGQVVALVSVARDISERKRAEEEIRWRAEALAVLHETALDLAARRALPDLLRAIVARAVDLLQAQGGGIYLYRPATDDLEYVLAHNLEPDFTGTVLQRGEGLSGRVLETGQPQAVTDYSQWPGRASQYEGSNLAAIVAVPITWAGHLLGVLNVLDDAPRAFSPADIALLERLTPLAAAALETTRLLQAEREQYQIAETLRQVAGILSTSLDQEQVLQLILEQLARVVDYDSASLMLVSGDILNMVAHRGLRSENQLFTPLRIENLPAMSEMIEHRCPTIIPDTATDVRWLCPPGSEYIRCWLGVPLVIQDRTIGFLNLDKEQPGYYTEQHAEIARAFADQAAIAIENARLFTATQKAYEDLKRTQAQLVQAEKLAAIGELAAGVAHELNNPLTAVLGFSELLLYNAAPDAPNRQELEDIAEGARRARDIVRNLLSFARQSDFHRVTTDVNQMVHETLALSRKRLEHGQVVIEERYATGLPLCQLDVGRIKQVVLNLITNALYAMPQGGTLTVTTDRVGNEVAIRVADTGVGIPAEHLSRIFDPFFTTKPVGQGTGLGLSVSLGIVQDHSGRIEVESREGVGSTFTVWLPV